MNIYYEKFSGDQNSFFQGFCQIAELLLITIKLKV